MAAPTIVDYASLQIAIALWLNRAGDSVITTSIGDFIANFEFNLILDPRFRVRQMSQRATAALSGQYLTLPTGFLGMRLLKVNTNPVQKLDYVSPDQLWETWSANVSGRSLVYSIVDSQLVFGPLPQSADTIEMLYYATAQASGTWTFVAGGYFAPLSNAATTNWLILAYPQLYLYGALVEAAEFIGDDTAIQRFSAKRDAALDGLFETDRDSLWSGSTLNIRTDTGAP